MGNIVVGVDGSEESKRALRWALEEAELRGADVKVVYAYEFTPAWREFSYAESMTREQIAGVREKMQREADEAREHGEALVASVLADVAGDSGRSGVKAETLVLQDHQPAAALVDQSKGADLLVVGSRGRGGFTGLVLGSVSQQCLHHAKCPVVVIRRE